MFVQVVSGFPPHLSVHSELPGSWKYSPIFGLVGAVDTTGGAVDVEVDEGFACGESIDKSSARISQIFNIVWLSRYPRPSKVIFDNGSEFKKDFVPLLKEFFQS